jgi:hypothetical protein
MGIGGWHQPRILTDGEKTKVVEIAVTSPNASAWLQGRSDYTTSDVGWAAIVWSDGKAGTYWALRYDDQTNIKYVSLYAYWYPRVTLELGQGMIYGMSIAVDLDSGKIAYTDGPYPSLSSPDRFKGLTPASSISPSNSSR